MIYGAEAFPLLNEEVEDCPPTKAKLVLIDEFCELDQNNNVIKFSYVKLYFTTEEIIVARRKMWIPSWKSQAQDFTFSRLHKLSDIMLKKELYFTDIMIVVDYSKDQTFHYRIDNSGELGEWVVAFERITELHEKKRNKQQEAITTEATASQTTTTCDTAVDVFEEESETIEGSLSNRFSALILWSRESKCLDTTASSNSVCSSQDLPLQLVTPVCSNQLSNPPLCKHTVLSCEEDVSSSPEPQESIAFDLGNTSISEEGDTNKEEMDQTYSLALETWTPSNDNATTSSCKEAQVIPDDKIHTLDTTVSSKGHSRNKSTSLTRGVQIVTQSDSTLRAVMSDPGAGNSGTMVQSGLAYANLHGILRSVSCNSRSNSFLSSPLRHAQIRDKKVRFSPKQKVATYPTDDSGSEHCLIYEYDTEDNSFCIIRPKNSATLTKDNITSMLLMPIRSAPTTKQEKGAMLAAHGSGIPTEDNPVFTDITTATEDNEGLVTKVKKPGKKKRRRNRFRRKSLPSEAPSHSAANCTGNTPHKRRTVKSTLKRRLSSPLRSFSAPACSDVSTQKKNNAGFLKRRFSSFRESIPVCDNNSTQKNNKTTPTKEKVGFLKRRFSPFRESSPVCDDDSSQQNDNSSTAKKEKTGFLNKKFPSREGSPICNDDSPQKREVGTLRKKSFPARETAPTPADDNIPCKKEKRGLRRKLSSSLSGHSRTECNDNVMREKLHIYKHADNVDGFDANSMLQQMQFSSMRYMSSIEPRADIQLFIKEQTYNSEEENYQMSIQMEPIEQNY